MKFSKILLALAMMGGAATSAVAQGYQDGVDNFNADRFEEAGIILNNTLNQPGTNKAVSYFYLGNLAQREGNAAKAKDYYDKGIAANDKYGFNYIGLGELALRQGSTSEAEKLFKQGMNTDKKDAALTVAVARAYFNVDPVKYAKDVEKYIKKAEKDSKYQEPAIFILKGDMLRYTNAGEAAGNYEMAMEYGEQMSGGEVNPEAYVKYANLYNKSNPQFAISKLELLAEKLPNSALAQRELAEKYYDGNQFTRAAQQYGKYIANPNHFQNDEQRYSGLLFFSKDYPKSLEVAQQVLAKDPANPFMHRMVMLNNAALKNWEAAEEAAKRLFGSNTEFTSNDYVTHGEVLAALERPQEALVEYEKAYNLNPEKNKAILSQMSDMYSSLENDAKAVELMQKYVDAGEPSLNDLFVLANRYKNYAISLPEGSQERKQAAQKGIDYVDLAMEKAATRGPLYRNKATLLILRDGNVTDEVVATYKSMIDAYNADTETNHDDALKGAYNTLGQYYYKKGDKANARVYYSKLLEIDPTNSQLKALLKSL